MAGFRAEVSCCAKTELVYTSLFQMCDERTVRLSVDLMLLPLINITS